MLKVVYITSGKFAFMEYSSFYFYTRFDYSMKKLKTIVGIFE